MDLPLVYSLLGLINQLCCLLQLYCTYRDRIIATFKLQNHRLLHLLSQYCSVTLGSKSLACHWQMCFLVSNSQYYPSYLNDKYFVWSWCQSGNWVIGQNACSVDFWLFCIPVLPPGEWKWRRTCLCCSVIAGIFWVRRATGQLRETTIQTAQVRHPVSLLLCGLLWFFIVPISLCRCPKDSSFKTSIVSPSDAYIYRKSACFFL